MLREDDLLRGLPFLRAAGEEELARLPRERREADEGGVFFRQGDPADAVFGVITGRVQILKRAPGGKELCLEILGAGDVAAAVAVLRKVPLPASGVAMEQTAVVCVPAEPFLQLVGRHPAIGTRLLDLVSRRLLEAGASRLSLATDPVEVRVARALLHMCERFGSPRAGTFVFSQPLTRQNLADLAGTTVETTIRVMSRWTRDGWIRSSGGRITVLAPAALRELAG